MSEELKEELKQLITWFENYQVTFNEIRLSECENVRIYLI